MKVLPFRNGKGDSAPLAKIAFELPISEWPNHPTEVAWAERIGPLHYRLRNVLFFARGVSFGDVVRVRKSDSWPIVEEVIERSGHSTYRVICEPAAFERRWPTVAATGCTYERGDATLVAIDVPPEADIHRVYKALEAGESAGDWDFEEGHCGHAV